MARQIKAEILKNERIAQRAYRIGISEPFIAKVAKPGQFIMVRTIDGIQPLLRRPFSVHRTKASNIEILYEVIGEGTQLLSQKNSGEYLDIIGPLGNGFDVGLRGTLDVGRGTILIAGGMGVAPLLFLAERLVRFKKGPDPFLKLVVLLGARTKSRVLCEKEFRMLGCDVKIATDDGSKGFKGFVTSLLKETLSTVNCQLLTIYACGPKLMLKEIAAIAKQHNISAQVSLEEHMACGIGACLGCVVNTKQGYKRVCKEGPVFDAREIIWEGR